MFEVQIAEGSWAPPAPLLTIPLIMQGILYTAAALWAVHSPRGRLWSSITPSLNQSSALPVMCWCNTSAQRQGWILQSHTSGKGTCPVCYGCVWRGYGHTHGAFALFGVRLKLYWCLQGSSELPKERCASLKMPVGQSNPGVSAPEGWHESGTLTLQEDHSNCACWY